ncbi:MAG: hypothetical protein MJ252_10625, partial [archaeon]|nr:hypothetical protein [archaeon]
MSSKSFIILLFIFSFISASEYTELSYLESKEIPFDKKEFLVKIDLSQYHQNNLENIYFNIKFNKAHKYGRILYAYGDSNTEDLKYNGKIGYNDAEDDTSKTVFHLIPVNKEKKFVFVKVLFFWYEEKIKSNLILKLEKEGIKTERESFE